MSDTFNSVSSHGQILIVDPDLMICDLIKYNLENEGYAVMSVHNANDALDIDLTLFNLIVTEVVLVDGPSGIRFVRMIKDNPDTAVVPVIFCTSRDSEDDIIAGFNAGADDYILKPFSLREMIARIKAVMRRRRLMNNRTAAGPDNHTITFNTLVLDLASQSATIDDENIQLTRTEFQILALLLKKRNTLMTRTEIFEAIRPGKDGGSERSVDVNISRVRKKLGRYSGNLVNKSGHGYGFMD